MRANKLRQTTENYFYSTMRLSRFVNQTLSDGLRQANIRALAIRHFPAVVAMVKLREIQRQMLCADMVKRPDHAAL
jgi:hypothetical protein